MAKPKRSRIQEEAIRTGGGDVRRWNQMDPKEQIRRKKKVDKT